jgi:hypothetical protein
MYARQHPARLAAAPRTLEGNPAPMREVPLAQLLDTRDEVTFARIHEGHDPYPPAPSLGPGYDPPVTIVGPRPPVPAIDVIAMPDVELRSDYMPYVRGEPVVTDRIYPTYVARYVSDPALMALFNFPRVESTASQPGPVFFVTHFNTRVYGHFLMEVLPKILLARQLRAGGIAARIACPVNLPRGVVEAAVAVCGDPGHLILFDAGRVRLSTRLGLFPTRPHSLAGEMHRAVVEALQAGAAALSGMPTPTRIPGPRIFLSRSKINSFRRLVNEDELFAVAARFGFERVHPQDLPWTDQVRMFHRSSHVVGEVTSALHNTLFCRPAASVVALGWLRDSRYQSAIAASIGHKLGCVMPRDGHLVTFTPGWTTVQEFRIEPDDLARCLEHVTSGGDNAGP